MVEQLARSHRVKVNGHTEVGPLVADDIGIGVQAKRKLLSKSHPGLYYIVKWSDVVSYTLAAPAPRLVGGSSINSHHTQLEVRTATNVYSWELPYDRAVVTTRIGRYLAAVDAL